MHFSLNTNRKYKIKSQQIIAFNDLSDKKGNLEILLDVSNKSRKVWVWKAFSSSNHNRIVFSKCPWISCRVIVEDVKRQTMFTKDIHSIFLTAKTNDLQRRKSVT